MLDTSSKKTRLRYAPYAHMTRRAVSAEWDHPHIGSWANSPLAIRGTKAFIKGPWRAEDTTLKRITEAGSRPLLKWLTSTRQSAAPRHAGLPWHWPLEALPCWTEDLIWPHCPPGSRDRSLPDADGSLAHHAVSRTCRLRLWDSGSLSPNSFMWC